MSNAACAIVVAQRDPRPSEALTLAVSDALALMVASLANPKEHSPALVRIWSLVVHSAGITAEQVMPIALKLVSSETFFPTPADFLKAARPAEIDLETRAEVTWLAVIAAVRRVGRNGSLIADDFGGDAAAVWVLGRMGWSRLCQELTDETRSFYRAEFVRFYRVAVEGAMALEYLPGAMALENDAQGRRLTPALVGRPDWETLPAAALEGQGKAVEEWRGLRPEAFAGLAAAMGCSR